MKELILQNLQTVLEYLNSGVGFVIEQAPVVVQQALSYYTMINSIIAFISFPILVISVTSFIVMSKKVYVAYQTGDYDGDFYIPFMLLAVFAGVLSFWAFSISGVALIKIWKAPSLFLLELLKNWG